jgi:hypothetical protein
VQQPQYLPSLSEVDLGWFQGKRNGEQQHMSSSRCTCSIRCRLPCSRLTGSLAATQSYEDDGALG